MSAARAMPIWRHLPGIGIGAALATSLIVATAYRVTGPVNSTPPPANVVAMRDLRFVDMKDGGVGVMDAANGLRIQTLAPGTNGFVRGLMRGFTRERRIGDLGDNASFRLIAFSDGRVTLEDVGTGKQIDLEAFGSTNAEVFAGFLTAGAEQAKNGSQSR